MEKLTLKKLLFEPTDYVERILALILFVFWCIIFLFDFIFNNILSNSRLLIIPLSFFLFGIGYRIGKYHRSFEEGMTKAKSKFSNKNKDLLDINSKS